MEMFDESFAVDTSNVRTAIAAGNLRPVSAISVQACHEAPIAARGRNIHTRWPAEAPTIAPTQSMKIVLASRGARPSIGRSCWGVVTRKAPKGATYPTFCGPKQTPIQGGGA